MCDFYEEWIINVVMHAVVQINKVLKKEIKEAFSERLKQFPFPICQQDLINVSLALFGMRLDSSNDKWCRFNLR